MRIRQNSRAPRIERMQPETLIRSLYMRISRSLALLSNGTFQAHQGVDRLGGPGLGPKVSLAAGLGDRDQLAQQVSPAQGVISVRVNVIRRPVVLSPSSVHASRRMAAGTTRSQHPELVNPIRAKIHHHPTAYPV
jgi:hypothetical protein